MSSCYFRTNFIDDTLLDRVEHRHCERRGGLFKQFYYKCDLLSDLLWFVELTENGIDIIKTHRILVEGWYNRRKVYFISIGVYTKTIGREWLYFELMFNTEDERGKCLSEIQVLVKSWSVLVLKRIGLLPEHEWEVMEYLGCRRGPGVGGVS